MIVVHPRDPGTRFLHLIYEDIGGVVFFDSISQREQILEAIRKAPRDEYILLLGHGTPYGLQDDFICDEDADLLRDRPNLVGIWSYASSYAHRHRLKGFFCGMFISEWNEALDNGIEVSPDEIEEMCWSFAGVFGDLLRAGYPLVAIADELTSPNSFNSDLARFNYSRLTCRRTGMEDLPVREDYWGCDDVSDGDKETVRQGVHRFKHAIDCLLRQDIDFWDDGSVWEYFVGGVERACLRQLLSKYQSLEEAPCKPAPKEVAEYLMGKGVVCDRLRISLFSSPGYTINLSGRKYNITRKRGDDTCCIEIMPDTLFTARDLRIYLQPRTFYTLLDHLSGRIVPLIRPAIEEYIMEEKKKILVSEIRKTAREAGKDYWDGSV